MGLPLWGGCWLCPQRTQPLLGSPSPHQEQLRKEMMKEVWSGNRYFQGTWQICGRDFNPTNVFTFTHQMPTTHSSTSHLIDRNSYFFFLFWLPDIYSLHIQREKYTCTNHIEFKCSWVKFNVYLNSQNIYISLCFLDCFFILNGLNNLKNHSRGGLFRVVKPSINFWTK